MSQKIAYRIYASRINILDSYLVSKHDFESVLDGIQEKSPDHQVWTRGMKSLCREWAVHNLMHKLGLWMSKTKDVSLDFPQSKITQFGYRIFGTIAMWFIK